MNLNHTGNADPEKVIAKRDGARKLLLGRPGLVSVIS